MEEYSLIPIFEFTPFHVSDSQLNSGAQRYYLFLELLVVDELVFALLDQSLQVNYVLVPLLSGILDHLVYQGLHRVHEAPGLHTR